MKQTNLKLVMMAVILLSSLPIFAYDFEVDGLRYDKTGNNTCKLSGYYNISDIEHLIIPERIEYWGADYSVTAIGSYALSECKDLISITLPSSIKEIEKSALPSFEPELGNEPKLRELYLNEGLEVIGEFAISAPYLQYITLPSTLKTISNDAFSDCGILEITIPENVASIGERAFYNCPINKIYYNAKRCNKIGSSAAPAFSGYWDYSDINNPTHFNATELTIGPRVELIPDNAFTQLDLTTIVIPESVESIGACAFYCDNGRSNGIFIKEIIFNARNCTNIGVNSYGWSAFHVNKNASVNKIIFGENVETIPDKLFCEINSLSEITIPQSVKHIGANIFEKNTNLNTIVFNAESATYINNDNQPIFPSSVNKIVIGGKVSKLPRNINVNLKNLSKIVLNGNNHFINREDVLFDKSNTELIMFPAGKKQNIYEIPDGVSNIGDNSFLGASNLNCIFIPNTVKEIGQNAFIGNSNLSKIILRADTPPNCANNCFNNNIKTKCSLIVPEGTRQNYESKTVWSDFTNISESSDLSLSANISGVNLIFFDNIKVQQGHNAELKIYYSSISNVDRYSTTIDLPVNESMIESVCISPAINSINNFYNTTSIVSLSPEMSEITITGEKQGLDAAPSGVQEIATIIFNTSSIPAGKNEIRLHNQAIYNDKNHHSPADFIGELAIEAPSQYEKCATPTITIENNNLVIYCETPGVTFHTSIVAVDNQNIIHGENEPIKLLGQYHVTTYSSMSGYTNSDSVTATLAWNKDANITTNVIDMESTRMVLIKKAGDNIMIEGLTSNETIGLYNLNGLMLYNGKCYSESAIIPFSCIPGQIYIVKVGDDAIKYKFP